MGHPRRLGRPTRCWTSHAAGLSQFGWVVPVWLGCPSLAGVSQLRAIPPWGRLSHFTGSSQPCMGRPTRPGCPSLLRVVPVRLGCPSLAGVSQLWSSHFEARAVPRHWSVPVPLGTSYGWAVPVRVGCPEFCWVVPVFTGSSSTQLELLKPYVKGHSLLTC